jgi:NTP pyrophosphatase (non-canonical NTP hydrolase)
MKSNDKNTTLETLRKEYGEFVKERNWSQYQDPKSVAVSITLEAAELLELFQWDTREQGAEKLQDPEWREKIKMELADIFIYTINFAMQADIDLTEVFQEKLEKVRKKYPSELVKTDLKAYRRIKEEHRKDRK